MTLDFWLEPMWLMYPALGGLALAVLFALSVRWTLKAHPVPDLNYVAEPRYHRPVTRATNFHQLLDAGMMMATATSSYAIIREIEDYRR